MHWTPGNEEPPYELNARTTEEAPGKIGQKGGVDTIRSINY